MTQTSIEYGGSAGNVDTGASASWKNLSYAAGSCSGSCSTSTSAYVDNCAYGGTTDWLRVYNFGFNLPTNATIKGIEVWIKHRQGSTANCIKDYDVRVGYNGSTRGSNHAKTTYWDSNYETFSYGSASDDWDADLTYGMVNSSSFSVYLRCKNWNSSYVTTFYVDCIGVRITYTTPQTYTKTHTATAYMTSPTLKTSYIQGGFSLISVDELAMISLDGYSDYDIKGDAVVEIDGLGEMTWLGYEGEEVVGYQGYIGNVRLDRRHQIKDFSSDKKDSIISNQFRGRGVIGKKGEPTINNSFKMNVDSRLSLALQGLVELDEFVPVDTAMSLANNNIYNVRGYALISNAGMSYLNPAKDTASISLTFLTRNLTPAFIFDYTQGILDGTAFDTEFEARNLNYAISMEGWDTYTDEFGDEVVEGLDNGNFLVDEVEEVLGATMQVETAGNYGYMTVTQRDTYKTPVYAKAFMYRTDSLPATNNVSTGFYMGNMDAGDTIVTGKCYLRARIVHSVTTSTLVVDYYYQGNYTTLVTKDLGNTIENVEVTGCIDEDGNCSVWYNIGATDVRVLNKVNIPIGDTTDIYIGLYGDSTLDVAYDLGWTDFMIWHISHEGQVFVTKIIAGETDTEGEYTSTAESNVAVTNGADWGANSSTLDSIRASDDTGCQAIVPANNGVTDYLRATGFGFSIPLDADILGVKMRYRRKQSSTNNVYDNVIQLVNNGAAIGSNKAIKTKYPSSYGTVYYGSAADEWSVKNLTPSIINSSTFGVQIQVKNASKYSTTVYADYVTLLITYQNGTEIVTEAANVPATLHNVIKAPITNKINPAPDFYRPSAEGDIPCYVNPTELIKFNIDPLNFYDGAVKLWDGLGNQILSVDYVADDKLILDNSVTKLEIDIETGEIILSGYMEVWSEINRFSIGEIYEAAPYMISSEEVTVKINETLWRLKRGDAAVTVEHPTTDILMYPKEVYYHDNDYGSGDEEIVEGINVPISMQNIFYCNVYNEEDLYRLQVMKIVKQNIFNDLIPADLITGLGWYYKNSVDYEHNAYRAREWQIQSETKILL